jgi:hypothetical protein
VFLSLQILVARRLLHVCVRTYVFKYLFIYLREVDEIPSPID